MFVAPVPPALTENARSAKETSVTSRWLAMWHSKERSTCEEEKATCGLWPWKASSPYHCLILLKH